MPKTRGGSTTASQSSQRPAPVRAPLATPSHLPDSAPQSRYHTRRASTTSVAPPQLPPRVLQREPKLEPETHPSTSGFTASPSSARDPACPLRAIQIADRETFMSRHISITLLCDSSQSCGIHTAYLRASILFTIDGRQSILGARQIAEAFHIPFAPVDPTTFRRWVPFSEWDMVRILSRGTSSQRTILRRELPPEMLLLDVVLRANLFPLQHKVQRRGAILEALFRISEGYYFGPHHLIMAALLHFEEKVHTRHLTRADSIPLLFPRLLCHIWLHRSPELPEPREVPPARPRILHGPAGGIIRCPTVVPPTSSRPLLSPVQYRALLTSFRTLTTTRRPLWSQTLILREIQEHLGLVPPAPPAVPSTACNEDPSYPPEEPTT
ncbi:hypothetical protein AAG906_003357 [Vitis piasezkii]